MEYQKQNSGFLDESKQIRQANYDAALAAYHGSSIEELWDNYISINGHLLGAIEQGSGVFERFDELHVISMLIQRKSSEEKTELINSLEKRHEYAWAENDFEAVNEISDIIEFFKREFLEEHPISFPTPSFK